MRCKAPLDPDRGIQLYVHGPGDPAAASDQETPELSLEATTG